MGSLQRGRREALGQRVDDLLVQPLRLVDQPEEAGLVAHEKAGVEQLQLDWYDDAQARVWRTYFLIDELTSVPHTAKRDTALRAVYDAEVAAFLPMPTVTPSHRTHHLAASGN